MAIDSHSFFTFNIFMCHKNYSKNINEKIPQSKKEIVAVFLQVNGDELNQITKG